jgi:hypothetical protein
LVGRVGLKNRKMDIEIHEDLSRLEAEPWAVGLVVVGGFLRGVGDGSGAACGSGVGGGFAVVVSGGVGAA